MTGGKDGRGKALALQAGPVINYLPCCTYHPALVRREMKESKKNEACCYEGTLTLAL